MIELAVADPLGRTSVRRVTGIEKDVARSDIAMDQAVRVRRIQRRRYLGNDVPGVAEWQRAEPVKQRPRVPAADIAHGDIQGPARLVSVVDGNDVRMVHRGGRSCLADDTGPEGGVAGQVRRQHLERHSTVQPSVLGQVDSRHAALT